MSRHGLYPCYAFCPWPTAGCFWCLWFYFHNILCNFSIWGPGADGLNTFWINGCLQTQKPEFKPFQSHMSKQHPVVVVGNLWPIVCRSILWSQGALACSLSKKPQKHSAVGKFVHAPARQQGEAAAVDRSLCQPALVTCLLQTLLTAVLYNKWN